MRSSLIFLFFIYFIYILYKRWRNMSIIIFLFTKDFLNTIVNTLCPHFFRRAAVNVQPRRNWITLTSELIYQVKLIYLVNLLLFSCFICCINEKNVVLLIIMNIFYIRKCLACQKMPRREYILSSRGIKIERN